MNRDELQSRTKRFALRIMKLADALPNTVSGRVVAGQIVRSGTSVGANYRAACRAKSKADFINKINIVLEEADETAYWLELIAEGGLLAQELVQPLHDESVELTKIFFRILQTSKAGSKQA